MCRIFDVFLEWYGFSIDDNNVSEDNKFQCSVVSPIFEFFLIHYGKLYENRLYWMCARNMRTACCSMTAKNVIMRKENIIEYVEWMGNGISINITSSRFFLSLNVFVVVLQCWNLLEATQKYARSMDKLEECVYFSSAHGWRTFLRMVINLKFSPVLSKSMYKFLMLLLFFVRLECPTAKTKWTHACKFSLGFFSSRFCSNDREREREIEKNR